MEKHLCGANVNTVYADANTTSAGSLGATMTTTADNTTGDCVPFMYVQPKPVEWFWPIRFEDLPASLSANHPCRSCARLGLGDLKDKICEDCIAGREKQKGGEMPDKSCEEREGFYIVAAVKRDDHSIVWWEMSVAKCAEDARLDSAMRHGWAPKTHVIIAVPFGPVGCVPPVEKMDK